MKIKSPDILITGTLITCMVGQCPKNSQSSDLSGQKNFKIYKYFIKNYDEKNEIGYIFEVDIKYPEKLQKFHMNLSFLPERKRVEKVENLIANIHDKTEYIAHVKSLKQAINYGLI